MHTPNSTRNPEILLQEAGEETLLYSPQGRAVHILNPTARTIWERCDGQYSIDNIAQFLRERFAVAPEHDVEGDVRRTIQAFADKGLLTETG